MLQAKLDGSYRKATTGTKVFRFTVSGTEQDLKAYEEAQGDSYRLDEKTGKPLWFTTRYIGDSVKLIITDNNNVVADDTELSKLQSLVDQFGPDVARLVLMQKTASPSAE
jgi:hypothetical protein